MEVMQYLKGTKASGGISGLAQQSRSEPSVHSNHSFRFGNADRCMETGFVLLSSTAFTLQLHACFNQV